jgi:type I restriction enzyme, S subunit
MNVRASRLPAGWSASPIETLLAPLEDGRVLHQGWSPQCEKNPSPSDDKWGVLKTTAIQPGAFCPEHNKLLPADLSPRPQLEVKEGDLLVTCAGPRARCGVACLVRSSRPRLLISGKMYRFRAATDRIEPRYLEAFLQTQEAQASIDKMKTGTSESGLNLTHDRFRRLMVPLAPLDEQPWIIEEIEKHLTRLDAGVAALKRVQANLKRYRAAILKAACEGNLAENEVRKAKTERRSVETGEQLLQRILKQRREQWTGKGNYKEPAPPETSDLPPLPIGWCWASAEQVSSTVASGSTPTADKLFLGQGEVPFIKVYNLTFGGPLDFSFKPTFINRETHEGHLARSKALPGDVLTNIVGPPLGKVSIVPDQFPEWNINQAIVVFRPTEAISNRLLSFWLRSEDVLGRLSRTAKATAGQFNIQVTTCRKLPLPLPPLAEQERIVAEVERRLSLADALERAASANLHRATRLRQEVLAAAFSGRLSGRGHSSP